MTGILLIGAGNVGAVVARDLVLSGCRDLTITDVDGARLGALAREHRGRVETLRLDVTDEAQLAKVMKGAAVAVNAASYRFNLHVLRAAIASRCSVVDLGGLYHMTLEELKYDRKARARGITAMVGMGDDPGTSNVMARLASWELDSVSEVRIRWGSTSGPTEGVTFGFSVATCLDEATMGAMEFSNGRLREIEPLSAMEEVVFPEPIGRQRTYAILHSEVATLPTRIRGVKNVTYKDSWDDATLNVAKFLRASGFASDRKVKVGGARVSPRSVLLSLLSPNEPRSAVGCLLVEVAGSKNGKPVEVTYRLGPVGYSERFRAPVTAYTTAIPASIVAQMVSKGLVEQTGVLPPEEFNADQVEHFVREMGARGLRVERQEDAG